MYRVDPWTRLKVLRGSTPNSQQNLPWKLVWKIPAQQRVRTFIYLATHDAFLSNETKVRRHLSSSNACPRCNHAETGLHLLRDCHVIKEEWTKWLGAMPPPGFFEQREIRGWIFDNIKKQDRRTASFANMLWLIWKCRNALVYDQRDEYTRIRARTNEFTDNYFKVKVRIPSIQSPQVAGQVMQNSWEVPPEGWVKLNFDGASKGNPGLAGGGGLIRDHEGNFLRGFMLSCGICSAQRAELLAACQGLRLGRSIGVTRLIVETDATTVRDLLMNGSSVNHPDYYLVDDCRRLIEEVDWEVRICHVSRKINGAADMLAQKSFLDSTAYTEYYEPPISLISTLERDHPNVTIFNDLE